MIIYTHQQSKNYDKFYLVYVSIDIGKKNIK